MNIESTITLAGLQPALERLFEASASKIRKLDRRWNPKLGTPVFTRNGEYTTRGWTEWTQGFQFGSALYQYEATGEQEFLDLGRRGIREVMASHVSHVGVHDHGFNNVSTYGNLWRLIREGRASTAESDLGTCELALKVSGRFRRHAGPGLPTTVASSIRSMAPIPFSSTRFAHSAPLPWPISLAMP